MSLVGLLLSPLRTLLGASVRNVFDLDVRQNPVIINATTQSDDRNHRKEEVFGFAPQYVVPLRRPRTDQEAQRLYNHIRTVSWYLDAIPFLGRKLPFNIGVESIIGVIPGVGDYIGLLLSLYALILCALFGLPLNILGLMVANVVIDTFIGLIPIVGDALDVAFKANLRNLRLMEDHLIANNGLCAADGTMAEQSVAAGNEERGKQLAAAAVTYPTTTVVPDEVFTTMRHIDRLQRSVQSMKDYFPKHWSQCNLAQPSALEGIIQEKVIEEAANLPHSSSHRVRISIDQSGRIKIAVFAMANPSSIENTDVDARLTVRLDSKTQEAFNIPAVLYNNKTAYREMYDEARHRVGATLMPSADGSGSVGPCFEVLMLAESAHDDKKTVVISESSIANVILVHHDTGQVLTPPADELLLLPGLFRAELLARRIIAEQHIPIDQLRTDLETGAASLYLCNALRGIIPVRLIE